MVNGDPTSGERLCLANDASQAGHGQVVKGSKFLFVEMTTSTIEDAFKYSQIFNKLVQYVLNNQAGIKQYYQALIPEMEGVKYDMTNKHSQNLKGIKNQGPCSEGLKDLKSVDYQTFGTGEYPRTCQKDKQPKAFPAKDLAKNANLAIRSPPFPETNGQLLTSRVARNTNPVSIITARTKNILMLVLTSAVSLAASLSLRSMIPVLERTSTITRLRAPSELPRTDWCPTSLLIWVM